MAFNFLLCTSNLSERGQQTEILRRFKEVKLIQICNCVMFLSIWDIQQDPFFEHDKEIDEQDNDRFITILPTKQMFQMLAVE